MQIILKYQSWDIPSILLVPPRMKTTSEDKFRGYKNAMRNLGTAYGLPVIDGSQFHFGYQSSDIFDTPVYISLKISFSSSYINFVKQITIISS